MWYWTVFMIALWPRLGSPSARSGRRDTTALLAAALAIAAGTIGTALSIIGQPSHPRTP